MSTLPLDSALALHRAGRFDEAEAAYRRLLSTQPTGAGRLLGILLLQRERFAEAATVLAPLSQAEPADVELAVNASVALRRSGQPGDAALAARRAVAADPARASTWNALGLAALDNDDPDEALTAFERGLALQPGHPALSLHRAQCLRRLGRLPQAHAAFEALLRADPAQLEAWRGLARVLSALGDAAGARECRRRALALAPADREIALEHAIACLHAGAPDEAAAGIEAALAADREDAQAWAWLGRTRLKLGQVESARAAFAEAHAREPLDPVIAHFHAALRGEVPAAIESDYIRGLFDDFADRFEKTLVDSLAYSTPRHLAEFIRMHSDATPANVLDLGCGTGLMAAELATDLAAPGRTIDGVDLSPRMLDHARAKGLYRHLYAAEVLAFLHESRESWDLIVAADVFVYLGELRPVFEAAHARLAPGGMFAFSIEVSGADEVELPATTGRYRHAPDALALALAACGFVGIEQARVDLRLENGKPVAGALLLATKAHE